MGTGALAALEPGHEELKSMRTDPQRRGQGVATQLLEQLLHDARCRRIRRISLETGSMEFFAPARALYATAGFLLCSPFGPYAASVRQTLSAALAMAGSRQPRCLTVYAAIRG